MKIKEAIEILERHNKWRRDDSFMPIPMENPTQLGIAIDTVVEWFQKENRHEGD